MTEKKKCQPGKHIGCALFDKTLKEQLEEKLKIPEIFEPLIKETPSLKNKTITEISEIFTQKIKDCIPKEGCDVQLCRVISNFGIQNIHEIPQLSAENPNGVLKIFAPQNSKIPA